MDCRTLTEIFAGERADDLTEAESAAFESHLEGCLACRERLAHAEDELAPLARWEPDEPRWERADRAIAAELAAPPVIAFRPTRLPAFLAAAAAVLLLVGAGVILQLRPQGPRDGAPPSTSAVGTDVLVPSGAGDVELVELEAGPGFAAEAQPLGDGTVRVVVTERE